VSRKGGTGVQKGEDNMAMSGLGCALGQSRLQGILSGLKHGPKEAVLSLCMASNSSDFSARVGYDCQ